MRPDSIAARDLEQERHDLADRTLQGDTEAEALLLRSLTDETQDAHAAEECLALELRLAALRET
jgi:hypothetical protein